MTRLLPLLSFILIIASCSKDDDPIQLTQSEQEYVNSFLVGTWEDAGYKSPYSSLDGYYPQCTFTEDFGFHEIWINRKNGEIWQSAFGGDKYVMSKLGNNKYKLDYLFFDSRIIKIKGDNVSLSPIQKSNGATDYNLSRINP